MCKLQKNTCQKGLNTMKYIITRLLKSTMKHTLAIGAEPNKPDSIKCWGRFEITATHKRCWQESSSITNVETCSPILPT